jgi:hypothetical protein
LRNTVRISRATVEASSVSGEDVGWLTEQVFQICSLPVKITCIYAARALLLIPVERRISQRAHNLQLAFSAAEVLETCFGLFSIIGIQARSGTTQR